MGERGQPVTSTPPPTSAVLMSISKHMAIRCSKVNKAYLACKDRDADPAKCLQEGDAVSGCVIDLYVIMFHAICLTAGLLQPHFQVRCSAAHIFDLVSPTLFPFRLKELNGRCPDQLKSYCECMDYYSNRFTKCRKEQKDFEEACPP
jgi:NADH dehydrogenase (ubiquinone) 1 alpha subcomplex subunit 8